MAGDSVGILLTGVGKRYDIVSAFAQHATVVAADPNPLAPAQYAADHRTPVPRIDDRDYVPALKRLCERFDVRAVLPLTDLDIEALALAQRLAGTAIETSLGATRAAPARFRWIERWERSGSGLNIIVPDWLFSTVVERRRVLRVTRTFLHLTGAIERWLWRLLRRHVHRISTGWEIPLATLHDRSGSLARPADFIVELRRIARRNVLPGYTLSIAWHRGEERLRAVRSTEPIHSAAAVPGDKPGFHPQNRGARL
jgi:hypothetical protein